ncbi:MAG: OsmC family protein [Trueperaceae bacterium]|nr:MAG: OsmC family protein [Trueperaceae bacterium]
MAKTHSTTVHHILDKRFVGITSNGHRVMIDAEPEHPTGMRPMQLLLNALGACSAFDIVEMLRKRRLIVQGYRVELEGERSESLPSCYTTIHAKHFIDAPGLDQRNADRFVELAMTKYCSVAASLTAEISFEVVLEHEQEV